MKTPTLAIGALALLALSACGGAAATAGPRPVPTTVAAAAVTEPATTTLAPPTTTPTAAAAPTAVPAPAPTAPPATTAPPSAAPAPTAPPTTAPSAGPAPADTVVVTQVIDGDTVVVGEGDHVRLIGIDTPEKGRCGYAAATQHMRDLVAGKAVVLTAGARDDVDKYGRLLRYVDLPDGTDAGLAQIVGGFAIARYDSRDGYGHHDREEQYVAADTGAAAPCIGVRAAGDAPSNPPATPAPSTGPATTAAPSGSVYYANCAAARAAGAAPLHTGDPGYRAGLDRDHDGVACE
jgi:endonuclease YncB( thermonuclease family)